MIEWQMPLAGGLLIGLSSSLLLWGIGRISGISGIVGTVITSGPKENGWRYAWIVGLLVGAITYYKMSPELFATIVIPRLIIAGELALEQDLEVAARVDMVFGLRYLQCARLFL